MIVGDPSRFAIESSIHEAYDTPSFLALGFFLIHVSHHSYGVRKQDATLIACSFEEVIRRVSSRGSHVVPFSDFDAGVIAEAVSQAIYSEDRKDQYLGLPHDEFMSLLSTSRIQWAPDGDEAFDDGSMVLQIDAQNQVRLIAFRRGVNGSVIPTTLTSLLVAADEYYSLLEQWSTRFQIEWQQCPKTPT